MPRSSSLQRLMFCAARRFAVAAVSALAMVSGPASGALAGSCERPAESTTEIGKVDSPDLVITPGGFHPPYRSQQTTARYYMLHLVPAPAMTGDWSLTLRDNSFHVLDVLGPNDFKDRNANGRWTGRLPAPEIVFDLYAAAGASGIKITLDEAIIMPENAINPRYSWQGQAPTYSSLYGFDAATDEKNRVKRFGDRVGFLIGSGPAPTGPASWCCSGVMLTSDLYLTNWHCGAPTGATSGVWHQDRCTTSLIDLSWDEDAVSSEFNCSQVVAQSEHLDYALLRVTPVASNTHGTVGARPLLVASHRAAAGTEIRVVHHAECKRKLLSKGCRIINASYKNWRSEGADATATEFTHDCDTEGGSSGAPVFDSNGALIGLHHLGFALTGNNQCDRANKAVHIGDILDDLKQRSPDAYSEIQKSITLSPN